MKYKSSVTSLTLTTTTTNLAPLTYQWQVDDGGGSGFTDITNGGVYSGATTTTPSDFRSDKYYECL